MALYALLGEMIRCESCHISTQTLFVQTQNSLWDILIHSYSILISTSSECQPIMDRQSWLESANGRHYEENFKHTWKTCSFSQISAIHSAIILTTQMDLVIGEVILRSAFTKKIPTQWWNWLQSWEWKATWPLCGWNIEVLEFLKWTPY